MIGARGKPAIRLVGELSGNVDRSRRGAEVDVGIYGYVCACAMSESVGKERYSLESCQESCRGRDGGGDESTISVVWSGRQAAAAGWRW